MSRKNLFVIIALSLMIGIVLGLSVSGSTLLSSSVIQPPPPLVCGQGYRLQNNTCVSDCAVKYGSVELQGDIKQINSDIDFVFNNPLLEKQYGAYATNIVFTYDRQTSQLQGQFDIANQTYTCRPFPMDTSNTFAATICGSEEESISTCANESTDYAITTQCTDSLYGYKLKKCKFPPIEITPSAVIPAMPRIGQEVLWNISVQGGNGAYTFAWSGTDNLTGSQSSIKKTYMTAGDKTATVVVSSGDQTKTQSLAINIASPLDVKCITTAPSRKVGQFITFTARPVGGAGKYTFKWKNGATTSLIRQKYTTRGLKTESVTVSSGSQSKTVECSVTIQ